MRDTVDLIGEQWAACRPDLDTSPMQVVGRLSRASRLLEASLKRFFAERGVEPWEFDVLATLRRAGPPYRLTAGQLVRAAMVSSAALTNRVDRLVARGFVDRQVDPANRRSVLISLTDRGLATVDDIVADHVDNERRLLDTLGATEQTQLAGLLRKLLIGLGDRAPTP